MPSHYLFATYGARIRPVRILAPGSTQPSEQEGMSTVQSFMFVGCYRSHARRLLMFSPILASALLMAPAALLAAVAGPSSADIYALLGVMPATVVVMYHSAQKGRTSGHFASVLCGSAAVGIFLPGVLAYTLLRAHVENFTWHVWMGLGFVCALAGWALTYATLRVIAGRSEWFMSKMADKVTGPTGETNDTNKQ